MLQRGMVSGLLARRGLESMARNPWLAGKPGMAGVRNQQGRSFSRTAVKQDFITPLFANYLVAPWHYFYLPMQWLIGHSYNILPWLLLLVLVTFIFLYGARLADYDRGHMLNLNFNFKQSDPFNHPMARVDFNLWRVMLDTWLSVTPQQLKENPDPNWVLAEDGSVEPSPDTISPGGLAAYHLVSGMSLRWELMVFVGDWNDSWCRRSHLLLIQPTWIIGGTETVHEKERSYVGDWTDEYFPYSRSTTHPLQIPFGVET
eukprot:TRINITY_DN3568_c2_g6_i1.p1 TRINITY_DN3568_c2_g6~~TRINITY_DN3568_c2_g6_i1.p1  ORF type:complete len:259 (+),score=34.56 TRINITY_DN3568_c2_g6_i1:38-814(+)